MAKKAAAAVVKEQPSHKLSISVCKSGPFLSGTELYAPVSLDQLAIGIQIDFSGTQVVSTYVLLRDDDVMPIHVWQGDVPPTVESRVDSINGFPFEVAVMCEVPELQKYVAKHSSMDVGQVEAAVMVSLDRWNRDNEDTDESGLPDDGAYNETGEIEPQEYEPPFQAEPVAEEPKSKGKGKTAANKGGIFNKPQEKTAKEPKLKIGELKPGDTPTPDEEDAEFEEIEDDDSLDEDDEIEDDESEYEDEDDDSELDDSEDLDDSDDSDELDDDDIDDDEDEADIAIRENIAAISATQTVEELHMYGKELGIPQSQMKKRTTIKELKKFLIEKISAM